MTSRRRSGSPNRKINSITSYFKPTKSVSAASRKVGGASSSFLSGPIPMSSPAIPPLLEPTSSFLADDQITRPAQKRLALEHLSPRLGSTNPLTLRLKRAFASTPDWIADLDLGSASDRSRSVSVSTPNTYRLAASRGSARAFRGRARDARDARRVLRTIIEVKEHKYKVKKGGPGGKYLVQRTLHYSGYRLLWEELEKPENKEILDYVKGKKFHFDYTRRPYKGDKQFVIHMPSGFRETVAGSFNTEIIEWLGKIKSGTLCKVNRCKEETMRVAESIRPTLATRVKCAKSRDGLLEPDLSFTYEDSGVAGLVVEVAWSQSNLKLPDRARRYIVGTEGKIRTVIGLNMNDIYRHSQSATFSVWRAKRVGDKWEETALVENEVFLNGKGEPVNGCELHLSFKDFMCEEQVAALDEFEDVRLDISSNKLHDLYKSAFKRHMIDEATEDIDKVEKGVNAGSEKILSIEKVVQEQSKEDADGRTVMDKTELASVKTLLSDVEKEFSEMRIKMDKVKEHITDKTVGKAKRKRIKVENEVAKMETKLAETRTALERILEATPKSKRFKLRSAIGLTSKK